MDIKIKPSIISGEIKAIQSKSDAHRLLIASSLSDKVTKIQLSTKSKDIISTIDCLISLGANIVEKDNYLYIYPINRQYNSIYLNFNESGSSFRFLLPVATSLYNEVNFSGEGRLPERPIKDLLFTLEKNGVSFSSYKLPFKSKGKLVSGNFNLPGDVSSQYISGLLLTAPLLNSDTKINVDGVIESSQYIDMTIDTLKKFDVEVIKDNNTFLIKRDSKYKTIQEEYKIEGDWSSAAFFLAAASLGGIVRYSNLNIESKQPDKIILKILNSFGSQIIFENDDIIVYPADFNNLDIDISQCPDLVPILAILATKTDSTCYLRNGKRLRLKESDRLIATENMINSLGGKAEIRGDDLIIYGTNGLVGGEVDSYMDHRIAMAAAIGSIVSREDIIIKNAQVVDKSYPNFFDDFKALGGIYNVI